MKHAISSDIEGNTGSTKLQPVKAEQIGTSESGRILKSIYQDLKRGEETFLHSAGHVSIGGIAMTFRRVDETFLPEPVKRALGKLKNNAIDLPQSDRIPGLYQFIGGLDGQYLYLIEDQENAFLAWMGNLIAFSKQ